MIYCCAGAPYRHSLSANFLSRDDSLLHLYDPAQVWVAAGSDLHEEYTPVEQRFEVIQKTEVDRSAFFQAHVREPHRKIQITLFGIEVVPERRAKQRKTLDPMMSTQRFDLNRSGLYEVPCRHGSI